MKITPNQSGTYSIVCNEYCGIGHHMMLGDLRESKGRMNGYDLPHLPGSGLQDTAAEKP
jgi:hypothetical protein